jgi:hypothetical protein
MGDLWVGGGGTPRMVITPLSLRIQDTGDGPAARAVHPELPRRWARRGAGQLRATTRTGGTRYGAVNLPDGVTCAVRNFQVSVDVTLGQALSVSGWWKSHPRCSSRTDRGSCGSGALGVFETVANGDSRGTTSSSRPIEVTPDLLLRSPERGRRERTGLSSRGGATSSGQVRRDGGAGRRDRVTVRVGGSRPSSAGSLSE